MPQTFPREDRHRVLEGCLPHSPIGENIILNTDDSVVGRTAGNRTSYRKHRVSPAESSAEDSNPLAV